MAGFKTKAAIALFCFVIISSHIAGLLFYWRDVHNVSDLKPIQIIMLNQKDIKIPTNGYLSYQNMYNTTDEVFLQFGLLNNCNFKNDSYAKCEVDKNMGFVGDTAALALLCTAIFLYAITLFLAIVSISLPKVANVVPVTFLAAFLCTGAGLMIFCCYYNQFYISYEEKNTMSDGERESAEKRGIHIHDYYVSAEYPLKITCSIGFYITFFTNIISLVPLSLSCLLWKPNEKKSEKSIKNDSIPPPQHQQQVPAVQQQHYPSQANQYPQQPHQGYPQQIEPVHPSHHVQPYTPSKRSSTSSVVSTSSTYL